MAQEQIPAALLSPTSAIRQVPQKTILSCCEHDFHTMKWFILFWAETLPTEARIQIHLVCRIKFVSLWEGFVKPSVGYAGSAHEDEFFESSHYR